MTNRDEDYTTVADAITAWEMNGPTPTSIALIVDALYGAREAEAQAWEHGYLRATLEAESDLEPGDNPYRDLDESFN